MGNSVVVHLIRHEKTKANIDKKYIGWTDEPIVKSDNQLNIPIHTRKVYGSDLIRCYETSNLYFPNADYHGYKGLREINFGDFEMKTYNQLKDNYLYRNWIDSPLNFTPPNGESFVKFQERVLTTFDQIVNHSGTYVLVVHGGVIRMLRSIFSPKHEDFHQIIVKHREILTLTWSNISKFKGGQRCESLLVEPIMEKDNL